MPADEQDPLASLAALERRLDEMLDLARRGSMASAEQAVRAAELAARAGTQAASAEYHAHSALARADAALDSAARTDVRARDLFDRWVVLDARVTELAGRIEAERRREAKHSEQIAERADDHLRRFNERADRLSRFLAELERRPPPHVVVGTA